MSKKNNKNNKKPAAPVVAEPAAEIATVAPVDAGEAVAENKFNTEEPKAKESKVAPRKKQKKTSSVGMQILKLAAAAVVVVVLFWFGFTTVVKEGNCAVILRFGAVREEITDAGLYFKLPWPFESVVSYDNRLQSLEGNRLETTTKDKRNIVIQSHVVWRIDDPVLFHNSVGANGSVNAFINDQVFSATNSTLGTYNLTALVSLDAEEIKFDDIQQQIFTRVHDVCLANYGIDIVDVSILRLSLPDANLDTVFEQMRADRESEIDTILAKANAEADKIITDADTTASGIENEGVTEAAKIKAEAEKEVAKIYADAQAANIELYQFLKNLDTAVSSVNGNTIMVVKANEYPFNILFDYAEIANQDTVLYDLSYILTQLPEKERTDLVNAVAELIEEAKTTNGIS